MPTLLAFLVVFVFGRPSFEIALDICNKWEHANALKAGSCTFSGNDTKWALTGAITALPWSFSQATSLTLSFTKITVLGWLINFMIMGFYTVYIGNMVVRLLIRKYPSKDLGTINTRQHTNVITYKYFLFPLFISAPLYILGWDIGRWFAVTCINYIMVSLSQELNYAESKFYIETKFITKLLRILIMLVSGVMILVGIFSDWIGLGSNGFGLIQILLVSFGLGLLFAVILGRWYKKHLTQTPKFEKRNLWYYANLFILLIILFYVRLPTCCQHNGLDMLAEPLKSLAKMIILRIPQ